MTVRFLSQLLRSWESLQQFRVRTQLQNSPEHDSILTRCDRGGNVSTVMGYHLTANTADVRESENAHGRCARVGSGYRYYSPELGRWLNRDPILELAFRLLQLRQLLIRFHHIENDIYTFCMNTPIERVDYLGLFDIWKSAGGAALAQEIQALQNLINSTIKNASNSAYCASLDAALASINALQGVVDGLQSIMDIISAGTQMGPVGPIVDPWFLIDWGAAINSVNEIGPAIDAALLGAEKALDALEISLGDAKKKNCCK